MLKQMTVSSYAVGDNDLFLDVVDKSYVLRIRDLPPEEKPREKMIQHGVRVLSVPELLAVILGVGTKKEEVLSMASRVLQEYGTRGVTGETDPKRLTEELAIPLTKSCQIVACFELGRRFFKKTPGSTVLRTPKQVYEYVRDMRELPKECLRGIYVNNHYQIVHDEIISIGSPTANVMHPREVLRPALMYGASAIILAHNHPSGNVQPSRPDIEITNQLIEACRVMGIDLLDHLIVTKTKFISVISRDSGDKAGIN